MQTMNTDQQTYYPNPTGPHQATAGYYMQNEFSIRNPNPFAQSPRMPSFYNGQPPIYISPPYLQAAPFVHTNGPRGMNPPNVPIIRPPNENSNGSQGYIPQTPYQTYPNNYLQQTPNIYSQPPYYSYPMPQSYTPQNLPQQSPSSQISNQPQYSVVNSQQQTQSSQILQTQTSQQLSLDQQQGLSSHPSQSKEKREKKPLRIVDPVSHKAVELETSTSPVNTSSTISTTTDENRQKKDSITDLQSTDEANKTQKQAEFRQQFARLLHPDTQTDKNANQLSNDDQVDVTSTNEKQTENVVSQSTSSASSSRSGSISRTKSPTPISTNTSEESTLNKTSEQPQPSYPGIRTRSITEDKINQDDKQDQSDSQQQFETITSNSNSMSDDTTDNLTNNEILSIEEPSSHNLNIITKSQSTSSNDSDSESINTEKNLSKRLTYTRQGLLSKRSNPISQERPFGLITIDGVTNINLDKISFPNPSNNPYIPADKNKIDANNKFLRNVRSILNKLTPQTYDMLLQKLDVLELDRYERLDGMINTFFIKAVNEPGFCSLYAKLCKHFQKKQVTVPSENGQTITHYFRQILLTRCQKEFENDYRQEIEYDKRKNEIKAITDEKIYKEEAENLEEDLGKAKRRKLGNIYFIGELFKLQMLTDTIMYDCIEYLLRDKTDEESLECLCRLLRTIGKELDAKAGEKSTNRRNLERHYSELDNIITQRQTSTRIRFLIQDVMDLRKANWVARRVEAKPTTIDEIHEQERIKREQQERDQERERQQRREHNRGNGGNNPQQYTGRGSRGSGIKQQSNRTDEERTENRFNVNSVRQLHSNDKRNQGGLPLNLAPPRGWSKGSVIEKKTEDDRSNSGRTGKPPTSGSVQQLKAKTGTSPGTPGYSIQRQPSRELARENSHRDRENAMESLRKTTGGSGVTSPNNTSMTNSREGSRNASRESSVSERTSNASMTVSSNKISTSPPPPTIINTNLSNKSFDEEKTEARVRSLIEEYTENYSDNDDRPVKEAIEDLSSFCTSNIDQQTIIVQELFTNVLEAKSRARKAVGHLLDTALHQNIISNEGFLSGFKMVIELAPDYAVDIPLIWQYIGEIIGSFISAPSSNMLLLKPILQLIPTEKSKQLFQHIIRYAIEFSSKSRIQSLWQSSGFSLNDLLKSDLIDSSFINEYNWLSETEITTPIKENFSPRADPQLVKLFKSVNDQSTMVTDAEIITYIQEHMNPNEKFYIRNIVLSYLEACLINREPQKKIQEDIAKKRMTILNTIIEHRQEAEIQAVYAIQNFVSKLEHPPKMAQLLFDIFYDDECVSEDAFFEWLRRPDQSETEGHSVVEISTKDFFTWLQQAETEAEEGEEEEQS